MTSTPQQPETGQAPPAQPGVASIAGHAPVAGPSGASQPPAPVPNATPAAGTPTLLSPRSALILTVAVIAAAVAAVLTHRSDPGIATAVLAGGVAFAGTAVFLNTIIGTQ